MNAFRALHLKPISSLSTGPLFPLESTYHWTILLNYLTGASVSVSSKQNSWSLFYKPSCIWHFFFFGLSNIHYLCITYLTPPTIGLACSTIYNWSSVTEMCSKDKHMTKADSVRSWKRNILSS